MTTAQAPSLRVMRWFTSGVDSLQDASIACSAVQLVLGDPRSLPYMTAFFPDEQIALDNGAYRLYKKTKGKIPGPKVVAAYANLEPERQFAFRLAMDVVGDPNTTLDFWNTTFRGHGFTPVYQWGAPLSHLARYLDEAPYVPAVNSHLVAIGGLAATLRGGHRVKDPVEKRKKEDARKNAIELLVALCELSPFRFHILGLNHLDAIKQVRHLVASGDASKWLDGRRYGYVFFKETRPDGSTALRYAPSGSLQTARSPEIQALAQLDIDARLAHNARIIAAWAEHKF